MKFFQNGTKTASWATFLLLLTSFQLMAESSTVINTSYTAGSERVLRQEIVVDASIDEAWGAFSTAEGLNSFAVPVVEFELKTGGKFHSNYKLGSKVGDPGTIYNKVLCCVPRKMVAFRIGLNEVFPAGPREAGTLFAVVEIEPMESPQQTKVIISMLGWGSGEDWEKVYKHFEWGNSYTLNKLRDRFISGPVNWQEQAKKNSTNDK